MKVINLKKSEVIAVFGGTQKAVAEALGIKQSSVSCWPEILSDAVSDRVRGAAIRTNRTIPEGWVNDDKNNDVA